MTETKRKQLELGHRVLHVIVRQEATPEEEKLRVQLEALYAELSAPRSSRDDSTNSSHRYGSDPHKTDPPHSWDHRKNVRGVLKQQQDGIQALVEMVKEDAKDLEVIATSLNRIRKAVTKDGGTIYFSLFFSVFA
ncbi:Uncharacterized protein FKW44_023436 [Caligus rogercresseyi]|uniref:Uncharacterized protein n=1 Tax=Caligus rogercresseyi TaxID=217165 RepID=A0A7T8GPR8_CALRO|nr:Uncharacterized protein FKW44_023436 [Caligus rogercresseyi]